MDQLHDNLAYKEFEKPDGIMTAVIALYKTLFR